MASTSDTCADGFPIRADIAGPGVRAAFYIQTVSTILFVWVSPKDVSSSHWSMVSTALGLSVAGIITGVRKEISLVDALIIIDAVLLAFYACDFMNSEFFMRTKDIALLHRRPSALWVISSSLCSLLSCVLGLYVWATAPTFGSAWLECNSTMTVTFLGLDLQEGRKVQLVLWGVNAALFIVRTWLRRRVLMDALLELVLKRVTKPRSNLELLAKLAREKPPFWLRFKIFGKPIKPPRFLLRNFDFIWAMMFCVFTIVSTEVMIKRYKKDHNLNTEWNFGQALPVLLTMAPVFSLLDALTRGLNPQRRDIQSSSRPSTSTRTTHGQQFSATLFLALWCTPLLRKELVNTFSMTKSDLKVLESLVAEAYERWDADGRNGDLKSAWLGESEDEGEYEDDEEYERRLKKYESIYFDASSHFSFEINLPGPDPAFTTQGNQFAAILWDALLRVPGLKRSMIGKSKVVESESELESLRVVVAQTYDLWKAHRERTKRFQWLDIWRRPETGLRRALAATNQRAVVTALPGYKHLASPDQA